MDTDLNTLTRCASILFTRFILNLRTVDNNPIAHETSVAPSAIEFASSITGNLGAPLDYSSPNLDDDLPVTTRQRQEDPLSIGVLKPPSLTSDMSEIQP
ncbi:hypothetical protein NLI96_g7026 [Meripilus lineatus]|uniref:Uncharacterized protein n=1 Tax=Meripilus lineatus TaxID=2056292 RepID=A0AAD5YHM2_9APHY|nr:hypothetical protein NLI96_g7026 [Physisporinus lineatus]